MPRDDRAPAEDAPDDRFLEIAGWQIAKEALHRAVAPKVGRARVDVGRTRRIGEGLDRVVFAAHLDVRPDTLGMAGVYVAHLRRQRDDARVRREAALLARLAELALPFAVPRVVGLVDTESGLVMVQEHVDGVRLPKNGRVLPGVPAPWEITARLAAQVHAIPADRLAGLVGGHETLRAHAIAAIAPLEARPEPELRRAHAWAIANLPPDEPSTLLHGDLLGQNILLRPDEPEAVLDWDYATFGHPAYDLAIVTRGTRKPFQEPGGRHKLVEAYRRAGGRELPESAIRIFELAMMAGWYRETLRTDRRSGEVQQLLQRIAALTPD